MFYWPPDQNVKGDMEMQKEIREMARRDSIIITGDFNYPYTDWVNTCLGHGQEIKFPDMLNYCTMEHLIIESTRGAVTIGHRS